MAAFDGRLLDRLIQHYGVQLQLLQPPEPVVLYGSSTGVLRVRKLILGFSPITLAFDAPVNELRLDMDTIEKEFLVSLYLKKKMNAPELMTVSLRSEEENVLNVIRAREWMTGSSPTTTLDDEFTPLNGALFRNTQESKDMFERRLCSWVDSQSEMPKSPDPIDSPIASSILKGAQEFNRESEFWMKSMSLRSDRNRMLLKATQAQESKDMFERRLCSWVDSQSEMPKSPDPIDSPIASSILKGAQEFNRESEFWMKSMSLRSDRNRMLLKATQAVFDDSVASKSPRYPTDLWVGYGFSCSLPAELLKGILEIPSQETQPEENIKLRTDATPPRGLCSVREEDELSEFSASFNSTLVASFNRVHETKAPKGFSASTSTFDSSPIVSELTWDIRVFVDPAMVLAQLGCSEYMTQLREQEIDMHAFLLLDEQNLKDIGVSTIGARKKIHHAIIKLRESARLHGYAI
ncbi:hypothetical protein Q1695_004810 [Nippostrongylus brasiliensis]|nr:hypothetical protein Q1695_004810 [Nippostrongylus brasiliensis]